MHQKIPRRLVPQDMEEYVDITNVRHPQTKVKGSYNISGDDGRLCIAGWKEFMEKEHLLRMGDKMLLLYLRNAGVYLFASNVPDIDPE